MPAFVDHFTGLIERYRLALRGGDASLPDQLRPGVSDAVIAAYEQALGIRLPEPLADLYRCVDGGLVFDHYMPTFDELDEAEAQAAGMFWETVASGGLYPVGDDGDAPQGHGLILALDYDIVVCEIDGPHEGRIVMWDIGRSDKWYRIADSMQAYLECYVDLAESGHIVGEYGPVAGGYYRPDEQVLTPRILDDRLDERVAIIARHNVSPAILPDAMHLLY